MTWLLLMAAAFGAGVMNSVAGGGSFLTFPALVMAGVPSINANASSSLAVFPGALASAWAYREDFTNFPGIGLRSMMVISLIGGAVGAVLLLLTPQHSFDEIVPWLLLGATLLFAGGKRATPYLRRVLTIGPWTLLFIQFLIAIYGGYFGGAMGILMLALYGLFGLDNLNAMNAMKTLLSGLLNAVAVLLFVINGKIYWPETLVMLVFATAGGYVGARVARKMNPELVRFSIILIGVTMTAYFFYRA